MFRVLIVITALALLPSCSMIKDFALDQLTGGSGKGGIEVDAQIGDRENKVIVGGGTTSQAARDIKGNKGTVNITTATKQTGTEVKGAESVKVNNTNVSPFILLLLILGWVLPTPASIWRGIFK